jgi:hypothetical protein
VEFFLTLSWAVERWKLSSVSLLLSLFLKLIGENIEYGDKDNMVPQP